MEASLGEGQSWIDSKEALGGLELGAQPMTIQAVSMMILDCDLTTRQMVNFWSKKSSIDCRIFCDLFQYLL